MEKTSKRGKIPQSDWPRIMARYEAGETLASIARTYDCSPPAISYIVSRSRSRQANAESAGSAEPQLIKAPATGEPAAEIALLQPAPLPPPEVVAETAAPIRVTAEGATETQPAPAGGHAGDPRGGNGAGIGRGIGPAVRDGFALGDSDHDRPSAFPGLPPRAAGPRPQMPPQSGPANGGNGGDRRRLHLPLGGNGHGTGNGTGNGHSQHNGAAYAPAHAGAEGPNGNGHFAPERGEPRRSAGPVPPAYRGQDEEAYPARNGEGRNGSGRPFPERLGPASRQSADEPGRREGGGSFIDQDLRTRVDGDIAAFLAAFDDALAGDTPDSRIALREATDRLLRAGARTRIELERLEARVPLSPRDPVRPEPAWRAR